MFLRAIANWTLAGVEDLFLRVPRSLSNVRFRHLLDGGTTGIVGTDEHSRTRSVWLIQSSFPTHSRLRQPGRMYLGRRLVPMRSRAEAAILTLVERLLREMEAAGHTPGPDSRFKVDVYALRRWLDFVRSDEYGRPPPPEDDDD